MIYPDSLTTVTVVNNTAYETRYVLADETGVLPSTKRFVRVLHEKELPESKRITPLRRPEVRPFYPNHHVPFGRQHQLLSREMNPLLTPGNWTAVYHFKLWVANNQGFGMDGEEGRPYDPRINYITGQDIGSPNPKVEALVCGGNILSVLGELPDSYIIETLDWRDAAPSAEWVLARPWLCTWAVNLGGPDGLTPQRFAMGTQPNGFVPGVVHPLLADPSRFPVTIPKWRCVGWVESEPPDPYRVYLPV